MDNLENKKIDAETVDNIKFKGRYISVVGRRKTSTAKVRLFKNGTGIIIINDKKFNQYFTDEDTRALVLSPLKLTGLTKDLNFSIIVSGGGKKGQADAVKHGFTRALVILDPALRPSLKAKGFITRDARKKERKKPGLKKARKAPQWSKR